MFAIAAGIAAGLGSGDNTRALVIIRAIAEMTRLGVAMGGQPMTFAGLAGIGDLLATCMSPLSAATARSASYSPRARRTRSPSRCSRSPRASRRRASVVDLADEHDVEMPIAAEVDAVVNEGAHAAGGVPTACSARAERRVRRVPAMADPACPETNEEAWALAGSGPPSGR